MKYAALRVIFAPIALRDRARYHPLRDAPTRGKTTGRTIWIDPRMPLPAKVLLHEIIHVQHPSWDEERVEATEEIRWSRMSWRDKARLYQLLGKGTIEGEES